MRVLVADVDPRELETDRGRRDAYARLWHQCYDRHVAAVVAERRRAARRELKPTPGAVGSNRGR
jgi:hypothetical protein